MDRNTGEVITLDQQEGHKYRGSSNTGPAGRTEIQRGGNNSGLIGSTEIHGR